MSTASLHDPVRHPDESQAQYRIRLAQSRRIAHTFATGFRRSAEPGFKIKRTVSHRQDKRARMAPLRELRDSAVRVAAALQLLAEAA